MTRRLRSGNLGTTRSRPALPRWLLGLICGSLVLLVVAGAYLVDQRRTVLPLHAGTIALGPRGVAVAVPDDPDLLVPGTRVLRSAPDAGGLATAQRRWLASGSIPEVAEIGDSTMIRDALLDLSVLASEHGVAVAGWSPLWHHVWPRDSALVAAALARTGHGRDAERIVDFLQRMQPESGVFAARYRPDGSGVPDHRGSQLDGSGWSLWALSQIAQELPAADRAGFVRRYRQLLDRSSQAILASIEPATGLPEASPDYWEVSEQRPTLATAALFRSGLEAATALYTVVGATAEATRSREAGARLTRAIDVSFAGGGFPRHPGGGAGSIDLGVSFLLPPFATDPHGRERTVAAWRSAAIPMGRAAGGLAPGGSWPDDGVSWTTSTSTYAVTAAAVGSRAEAVRWLQWLDAHRTAQGSLPEKVLYNGEPASVAPLAWTAAAVVIAATELER